MLHRRCAGLSLLLAKGVFALADAEEKSLRFPASIDHLHLIDATDCHPSLLPVLATIGQHIGLGTGRSDAHTKPASGAVVGDVGSIARRKLGDGRGIKTCRWHLVSLHPQLTSVPSSVRAMSTPCPQIVSTERHINNMS